MTEDQTVQTPEGSSEDSFAPLDDAVAKYRRSLEGDLDKSQDRYGFTLYHSLSDAEKVVHLEKLGFEPQDSEDHYNLGCVAAGKGDLARAMECFEKALADNPRLYEAAHNLAVAKERSGQDAKAAWQSALALASDDEKIAIEAHLAAQG